jgi:EAL domain-containing protein (putative c-di-GMP-specific phosphodiesterase class I)
LTENVLIEADDQTLTKLDAFNKQGCKVAVDDFGTGYSSLSYLKQLPVDIIKIDRSFISGLPEDQGDAAILQAIIAMGHSLNIRVLAEGVETYAQEAAIAEKDCDLAQGYLYHRPMPLENLLEVLIIKQDDAGPPE